MIARLVATNRGLELTRITRITRSRRDRRAIIVVGRNLYAAASPEQWPVAPDRDDLLYARSGNVRYAAKAEIGRAAADRLSGMSVVLIPEDFVRRGGGRLRRSIALRARRFRTIHEMRRRRRLAGAVCLVVLCAAITGAAARAATGARMTIDAAASAAEDRELLSLQMTSLREERDRLGQAVASSERRAGLPPGTLADVIVALLDPGDTLESLTMDGGQISIVVTTGGAGFAERLETVPGIVPVAETLTRNAGGIAAAIRARIGD